MLRGLAPTALVMLTLCACLPDLPEPADEGGDAGTEESGGTAEGCGVLDPLTIDGNLGAANCHASLEWNGPEGLQKLSIPSAGDAELLYRSPVGPTLETGAGILLYEPEGQSLVSWQGEARTGNDAGGVLQDGVALYRFKVASDRYLDGAALYSTTIYTMLADGRILRDNYAAVEAAPPTADGLTSYLALRTSAFTHVDWSYAEAVPYVIASETPSADIDILDISDPLVEVPYSTCVYDQATGATVGFSVFGYSKDFGVPTQGSRTTRFQHGSGDSLNLEADWIRQSAPVPNTAYNDETMIVLGYAGDGDPCAKTGAYHAAYENPGGLVWTSGFSDAINEPIGAEGSSGSSYSYGGGFYYVKFDGDDATDAIVVALREDATEQPTLLLHVAALDEGRLAGVRVGDVDLSDEEYLIQAARAEGDPDAGGLHAGLWVLIGRPVRPRDEIRVLVKPPE